MTDHIDFDIPNYGGTLIPAKGNTMKEYQFESNGHYIGSVKSKVPPEIGIISEDGDTQYKFMESKTVRVCIWATKMIEVGHSEAKS